MKIRVVIVDDHFVTRMGTIAILRRDPRFEVVGEAADGVSAFEVCHELHPDLVLLDTRLPKMDGPAVARALRDTMASPPKILMLSAYGDAGSVHTALESGATGYALKSVSGADLLAAIEQAMRGVCVLIGVDGHVNEGSSRLSPQELVVLGYLAEGLTSKEIAKLVTVSPRTVETYLTRIYRKLGARNRAEAFMRSRHEGLLAEESR